MRKPVRATRTRALWGAVFFLYFSMVTVPAAHAYVDPGTGSYIFQVLIGVFLGMAVALKLWWRKLWGFIARRPSTKDTESTDTVPGEAAPVDRHPHP
jgi:hypothetical protein